MKPKQKLPKRKIRLETEKLVELIQNLPGSEGFELIDVRIFEN